MPVLKGGSLSPFSDSGLQMWLPCMLTEHAVRARPCAGCREGHRGDALPAPGRAVPTSQGTVWLTAMSACHGARQCHGREVIAVTVSADLGGDGGCSDVRGNGSFRTEGKWFGCFSVSA